MFISHKDGQQIKRKHTEKKPLLFALITNATNLWVDVIFILMRTNNDTNSTNAEHQATARQKLIESSKLNATCNNRNHVDLLGITAQLNRYRLNYIYSGIKFAEQQRRQTTTIEHLIHTINTFDVFLCVTMTMVVVVVAAAIVAVVRVPLNTSKQPIFRCF